MSDERRDKWTLGKIKRKDKKRMISSSWKEKERKRKKQVYRMLIMFGGGKPI